jgi:hypothetical protein
MMQETQQRPNVESHVGQRHAAEVVATSALVLIGLFGAVWLRESHAEARPFGMRMVAESGLSNGAVSVHGRDYSHGSTDGHSLTTCDMEKDGNPVRGVYGYFDPATGYGDVVIEDIDGVGGNCASITTDRTILRHRTCERNLFAWDCDNWQDNLHPNA